MLKVQKELVTLKQRANENELKNQQERKINQLETQTNKLRNQCMVIREECDKQEKDIEYLNKLRDELEDDRKFLDYEIRDARSQNRMLKITLSKVHNQCEEQNQLNQTTKDNIMKMTMIPEDNENEDINQRSRAYQQNSPQKDRGDSFQYSLMEKQTEITTGRQKQQDKSTARVLGGPGAQSDPYNAYLEEASEELEEDQDYTQQEPNSQSNIEIKEEANEKQQQLTRADGTFINSEQQNDQQILNTEYTNDIINETNYKTMLSGQNGQKLKYMTKISRGFKPGEGPVDLKKTYMYNHKITQQVFDILQEQKSQEQIATEVEDVFKDDFERRAQIISHLRSKLQAQILTNQIKQRKIEEQKKLIAQKKQSQLLLQTFKNCIEAVLQDKKEKHNITYLSKEQLYPSEKKRILELFVENDNTLSHLLEFISSKLMDSNNQASMSQIASNQPSQIQNSTSFQRRENYQSAGHYPRTSLLSGTGEIGLIQQQSTNAQLQGLPVQSNSSDKYSTQYFTQHHLRAKGTGQHAQTAVEYHILPQRYNEPHFKDNSYSPYGGGSQIRTENAVQSKTTLRLAGQASLSKNSNFSGKEQIYLAGCSENVRKFYFENDGMTIIKKCKEYEVDVYECVFNTDRLPKDIVDDEWREFYHSLRKFVPKYYEAKLYDSKLARFNVRLENLLNIQKNYTYDRFLQKEYSKEDLENYQEKYKTLNQPSYIDLKIGTNCVLRSVNSPSYNEFREFDLITTTIHHGFRVTGFCIQESNQVVQHQCEGDFTFTKTYDQVKSIFVALLKSPSGRHINSRYIQGMINWIKELESACIEKGRARIVGSSLLFVLSRDYYDECDQIDSDYHIAQVKLIDLCHMELFSTDDERDWGFIQGLKETQKLLSEIIDQFDEEDKNDSKSKNIELDKDKQAI